MQTKDALPRAYSFWHHGLFGCFNEVVLKALSYWMWSSQLRDHENISREIHPKFLNRCGMMFSLYPKGQISQKEDTPLYIYFIFFPTPLPFPTTLHILLKEMEVYFWWVWLISFKLKFPSHLPSRNSPAISHPSTAEIFFRSW